MLKEFIFLNNGEVKSPLFISFANYRFHINDYP